MASFYAAYRSGLDNFTAAYIGTICIEAPWPRDQRVLDRIYRNLDRRYDYWTWDTARLNGPFAYWRFSTGSPVRVTGRDLHVPVLLFDETSDAPTPFSGDLYVRHVFPTSSLIDGLDGTTHEATLDGIACVDDTIARYLATGTVPPRCQATAPTSSAPQSGNPTRPLPRRAQEHCSPVCTPNPPSPDR